jgi:beta-N-acetylhexosaminidase
VTVTASGGRETSRALLERTLKSLGVPTRASGGTVVHLVGYGDGAADLRDGAAVTVAMDTPYLLARARSATLLATYSSSPASLTALARVIAGKARPTGRSPVPVSGLPRTVC